MSTEAQLEAYGAKDRTPQQNEVAVYLLQNPLATIIDMERDLKMVRNTVTARLNDLQKKGMVFEYGSTEIDGDKYTCYAYDNTPANWPERKIDFKKRQVLKKIKSLGVEKAFLPPSLVEDLREAYKSLKRSMNAS